MRTEEDPQVKKSIVLELILTSFQVWSKSGKT
jgi:hypothetical protein